MVQVSYQDASWALSTSGFPDKHNTREETPGQTKDPDEGANISHLAREHLRIPKEKLESVGKESDGWKTCSAYYNNDP